ncbi:MAG: hypothetical protein H0S85_11180 [Desulfovibrionaceae bacterium]|jgi:hypothetical protein|nr:hypothetical protein [Desulfovibrionaceae bacterium]
MTYDPASMSRIEGVPGKALYRYSTTDALSAVTASGYFDDAVTQYNLATGDAVLATTGAASAAAVALLVATNTAGTVTVVNAVS